MRILAIETSCDETAVSIVDAEGDFPTATYEVLGTGLLSQASKHAEYGGVYPTLAKREHIKNLVPMLRIALQEADLYQEQVQDLDSTVVEQIRSILERESDLATDLLDFLITHTLPQFDLIAVTNGPGLAPALWVGVNFAKALAAVLNCPVLPVNHMEGHIFASVYDIEIDNGLSPIAFPAVSLLISGGHTELVLLEDWQITRKIGQTRDDAVGECFDKVARTLGLPYPGGPAIERLSAEAIKNNLPMYKADLPRPMLYSGDLDFSFSGLKTSVRYAVADKTLTATEQAALCRDVSEAIRDVLLAKTHDALQQYGAPTLIVGGGVSASQYLRDAFTTYFAEEMPDVTVYFPHRPLSTDNAVMIALAAHARLDEVRTGASVARIAADGNRSL